MEFKAGVFLFVVNCLMHLSKATDEVVAPCLQAVPTGECRAAIQAWTFDPETCSCKEFTFGGCGDSKNIFSNRERCMRKCQPNMCVLPSVTGPCRAIIPMWYFNKDSKTCEQFTYGGCGGNENRFTSRRKCLRACNTAEAQLSMGSVAANDRGCQVPGRDARRMSRQNRRRKGSGWPMI